MSDKLSRPISQEQIEQVRGWTCQQFTISDAGANVPCLLRKVADAIEELGDSRTFFQDGRVLQGADGLYADDLAGRLTRENLRAVDATPSQVVDCAYASSFGPSSRQTPVS